MTEADKKNLTWQPLRELAQATPYTMGYLSLMARRGQLKVRKIGRVWHSTIANIQEFEKDMEARKRERKIQLSRQYKEKSVSTENENGDMISHLSRNERSMDSIDFINRTPTVDPVVETPYRASSEGTGQNGTATLNSMQLRERDVQSRPSDTIFDEIQKELMEVLDEIREKERKIKQNYRTYRENISNSEKSDFINQESLENQIIEEANQNLMRDPAYLKEEERQTEEISDKLIDDLGKLLNVADKAHREAKYSIEDNLENEAEWVPINISNNTNIGKKDKEKEVLNERVFPIERKEPDFAHSKEKYLEDNFLNSPYNAHPFEYRRREYREPEPRKNYSQIIIILLAIILIAIAGIIFYLAEV